MSVSISKPVVAVFGIVAALGLCGHALAVDGVILIDQNRATAGNVTVDDAPGFPITIRTSGSYRLAGNLNVGIGGVNTTAIEIGQGSGGAKLSVTLDLNGFQIVGSPVCDFNGQSDVACLAGGSGVGIRVDGNAAVTITNGAVRGMGLHGIACLANCNITVDGVLLANNGGSGFTAGAAASVMLTRNTLMVNRAGISASRAVLQGNVVEFNLLTGIIVNNSTLWNNLVSGNGGLGLSGPSNGYANNSFTFNNGGNQNPQVGVGSIQTSGNVCGTVACP
jgi:hypothetical protein